MAPSNTSESELAELVEQSADLSDRAERAMDSNPSARVEPATIEDLPELVELITELMELQGDFIVDREAHERGLALILEQPNRGRIFVLRNDDRIFGMVNLLFTISTALGGLVIMLEDFIIHPNHRGQGYGAVLLDYVFEFAEKKDFKRITLLTDKIGAEAQKFFKKVGFEHSNMIPMRRMTKRGQEDQAS